MGTGRTVLGDDVDTLALRGGGEGLGGHPGHRLETEGRGVGRVARDRTLTVVGAGVAVARGDVDGHVLQLAHVLLRVVLLPARTAVGAPHLLGVVAGALVGGVVDRLRDTRRGGVEVAGERADELEQLGVAVRQVDRGGATHRDTGDRPLLGGPPTFTQDSRELLGEEGLPLVGLAGLRLFLPVGVEGGVAADGHNDVDVLVGVELLDVGHQRPTGLAVLGAQAVHRPDGREVPVGLVVPVAGQQDLDEDRLLRHGRGVDVDVGPPVTDPLDTVDVHAVRQARQVLLGGGLGDALGDLVRLEVAGTGAGALGCGRGRQRQSKREGERHREHSGAESPRRAADRGLPVRGVSGDSHGGDDLPSLVGAQQAITVRHAVAPVSPGPGSGFPSRCLPDRRPLSGQLSGS